MDVYKVDRVGGEGPRVSVSARVVRAAMIPLGRKQCFWIAKSCSTVLTLHQLFALVRYYCFDVSR